MLPDLPSVPAQLLSACCRIAKKSIALSQDTRRSISRSHLRRRLFKHRIHWNRGAIGVGSAASRLVQSCNGNLMILLRIAQTRAGAVLVLNAGFFPAVSESRLFSTDPELGFDIGNAEALTEFFKLLLAALRVVNAIVLSCGDQNEQTISQARRFLDSYRPCMISILKRNANIGSLGKDHAVILEQLVDNFSVLVTAAGFIEVRLLEIC
ncbi:hypothetical protein MRB53_039409 [Persea americana]|nr:hypothetical protein MRB53_039409 [Persea americana]